MKKLLYLIFVLNLMSCSVNNDVLEDQQDITVDLEPNKAFVHNMQFPKIISLDLKYYTFNYENGRLIKMVGKLMSNGLFFSEPYISLSYNNNKVTLKHSDDPNNIVVYTMENNILKSAELYMYDNILVSKKSYTYETDKVIVYEDRFNKNNEVLTTFFFDSNKNLTKSEKLEKSGGMDMKFTTVTYLDFDHAKNPFKKLSLMNDNFYEKSLSANNFRAIEAISQNLPNPANGNTQYPPGYLNSQWTYPYDFNGEILLYHAL